MRIVVALGGNALLKRGEPMTAEVQRGRTSGLPPPHSRPLPLKHQLVISHGNGPQVGCSPCRVRHTSRMRLLRWMCSGAQTEGSIGYMIEQELGNLLPIEVPFATLLTMVEVDPDDPGFRNPTKFVGPVYEKAEADRLAAEKGWEVRQDGAKCAASCLLRLPKRIFEIRPVRWLLEHGTIVICGGGGGIPTMYAKGAKRQLVGVEAVIDKDMCSELLARELEADLYVMLTDADAVFVDWGKPTQRAIRRTSPKALEGTSFAAGSMGPKVQAACRVCDPDREVRGHRRPGRPRTDHCR